MYNTMPRVITKIQILILKSITDIANGILKINPQEANRTGEQ